MKDYLNYSKNLGKISYKIFSQNWLLYRVLCERSAKQYQQRVLEKMRKNLISSWLPFLKLKELLSPEISKFTKICKFQKNWYANLRLLNDYALII